MPIVKIVENCEIAYQFFFANEEKCLMMMLIDNVENVWMSDTSCRKKGEDDLKPSQLGVSDSRHVKKKQEKTTYNQVEKKNNQKTHDDLTQRRLVKGEDGRGDEQEGHGVLQHAAGRSEKKKKTKMATGEGAKIKICQFSF